MRLVRGTGEVQLVSKVPSASRAAEADVDKGCVASTGIFERGEISSTAAERAVDVSNEAVRIEAFLLRCRAIVGRDVEVRNCMSLVLRNDLEKKS